MPSDLILYDGVCVLCNWSVRFALRHDRREKFFFAPLQGETAQRFLARAPEGTAFRSFILVRDAGTDRESLHTKSDAVMLLLSTLGGFWRWLSWCRFLPLGLRDAVYDLIARHRYRWFGKYDVCPVPPPGIRSRFLP